MVRAASNLISFLLPGWSEELHAQLSGGRLRDARAFDPPKNGVWHRLRACATPQIQLYTQVSLRLFTCIHLHLNALKRKPNALCITCWSFPATTSWCCLSNCQKLQHQWFCCGGRALSIPLIEPCGGCHSNQECVEEVRLYTYVRVTFCGLVLYMITCTQRNRTWWFTCKYFIMWLNEYCG